MLGFQSFQFFVIFRNRPSSIYIFFHILLFDFFTATRFWSFKKLIKKLTIHRLILFEQLRKSNQIFFSNHNRPTSNFNLSYFVIWSNERNLYWEIDDLFSSNWQFIDRHKSGKNEPERNWVELYWTKSFKILS